MLMKKVIRYFGMTILLVVMTGIVSSCIKEQLKTENDATIFLRVFETRVSQDDSSLTGDIGANEGIKNMRVIIIDADTRKIEINEKKIYNDDSTIKSLMFIGVKPGKKSFYIIANESSIGLDDAYYTTKFTDNILPENFLETVIEDNSNDFFPKMRKDIVERGLPITGYLENVVISEGENTNVEITTYHSVAKISFSFINNSGTDIPVSQLNIGKFINNRTSLFKSANVISPLGDYKEEQFALVDSKILKGSYLTDAPTNKNLFEFYVYETDADPSNYTLSMQTSATGVNVNQPGKFLSSKDIKQNNWIQVVGTINRSSVSVTTSFNWRVKEWGDVSNDIPSFN